nr:transposase [Streptomyces sp. NBC_00857]
MRPHRGGRPAGGRGVADRPGLLPASRGEHRADRGSGGRRRRPGRRRTRGRRYGGRGRAAGAGEGQGSARQRKPGDDAHRDRQAPGGAGDRPAPGSVHRRRTEGRGRLEGAGRGGVAFPPADAPGAVAGDLAGRLAARAGAGDHRHAGGAADLHGAPDRCAGGEEGHRAAGQRVQEGVGQGEHPLQARRGVARHPGGDGPSGRVPGGVRGRGDAAGAGARVQDPGAGLPADGADHFEGVVHQPLPARADQALGRAGVPFLQPHAPAGDRGPGAGGAVRERGEHLRYVRRRYLSAEAARAIAVQIANATFAARSTELWGQGSTAVASDSTHVRAYDQNLFTEWHSRYGGRGVLIYWHVEKKSLAIHSQLINCTASEVAAMIEGAMRHGTTMDVEANYTDSHGQSEIGFGVTRLLNFDLLPRIKRINKVKLYRPVAGEPDAYPQLTPALTRPIRWELIAQQYDQMIKYATAIRTRTASTEAILRRFTRNASHPTYAAMLEVGRAQKTIFVARYLRLRDLQWEIEEGLNVMESSNGANSVIAYGKGGEISSNRRDEQEMFVLCLRILPSALVYLNTLMLQDILGEPEWADLLTPADRRGLTPLFWSHVRPYGEVNLDMGARLNLAAATVPGPRSPADTDDRQPAGRP